jgi:CBS domain
MTITVTGATRKVATLMARRLLSEGQRGRALVHDPSQGPRSAPTRFPAGDHHRRPEHGRLRRAGIDRPGGNLARLAIPGSRARRPAAARPAVRAEHLAHIVADQPARGHWNIDFAAAGISIRDAARFMVTRHFRHLPVVGEAGLIGMVDITDVCATVLDPPQDHLLASRDRRTPGRPGRDGTHRTSEQEQRCA